MQNTEKAPSLVASSKIQEGMSFRDRLLRSQLESKKAHVEAPVAQKKTPVQAAAEDHPAPAHFQAHASPIRPRAEESGSTTQVVGVNEYAHYFESCEAVTFQEGPKPCLDTLRNIPSFLHSETLTFAHEMAEGPVPLNFVFGRRTDLLDARQVEEDNSFIRKQSASYVAPHVHAVQPPTLHDSKPIFNQPWLPFSEHPDRLQEQSNRLSEGTSSVDFHQYTRDVNQSEGNTMIPGYKRDFLFPNRKQGNNYPRKRQTDYYGRMVPPAYPPMPTAFEYHSPFQMPFHHHGMPNPSQTQVPPNFHHAHFMPAFHPPAGRQANPTGNEMYGGIPNNMNYPPHYPLNYGHH